jgi:hypothetical protein
LHSPAVSGKLWLTLALDKNMKNIRYFIVFLCFLLPLTAVVAYQVGMWRGVHDTIQKDDPKLIQFIDRAFDVVDYCSPDGPRGWHNANTSTRSQSPYNTWARLKGDTGDYPYLLTLAPTTGTGTSWYVKVEYRPIVDTKKQ